MMLFNSIPWKIPTNRQTMINERKAFNLKTAINKNNKMIPSKTIRSGIKEILSFGIDKAKVKIKIKEENISRQKEGTNRLIAY